MKSLESTNSRKVAYHLLVAVLERRQSLDRALEKSAELACLSARDRAFARMLTNSVLRWLHVLDRVIEPLLRHPLKPKDRGAYHLLRLGAAQLLLLKTPPHAAVANMTGLADGIGMTHLKGLINALLRRIADAGVERFCALDHDRLTLPGWLWSCWSAAYGEAATRAIARQIRCEPLLDISLRPGSDPEFWAQALNASLLPSGSLRCRISGAIADLPGFAEGQWWVQDAAAALPVKLLGPVKDRRVADLCAAPGGKSLQLAAAGARVTAVDRASSRMKRVEQNLARLNLPIEALITADIAEWRVERPFDAILLDAPCSATGTARRHPDLLHLKTEQDVTSLIQVQDRLIDAALARLKPGGTLVFCTCSLQPQEGPERVAAAFSRHPGLRRQPIEAHEIGGPALHDCVSKEGDLRTLPHHLADFGGLDGFYAARLTA